MQKLEKAGYINETEIPGRKICELRLTEYGETIIEEIEGAAEKNMGNLDAGDEED